MPTLVSVRFFGSITTMWYLVAAGFFLVAQTASADGTDMLGDPSVELANGSRFVGAGVGLALGQPEEIEITVPDGASVEQVLIYWDGFDRKYAGSAPIIGTTTDTIEVSTNVVEGVFIGGRARLPEVQHFTFRADITDLELVSAGPNSLLVGGLDFGANGVVNGVGVLVVINQGFTSTLMLVDGSDYAYVNCADDFNCQETVKQMFTFPAANTARDGELTMFFAGVAGTESGGGTPRPSVIRIWVGAEPPIELINQLNSNDGEEWDTLNVEFEIPAGVTHVEVQAFSEDANSTAEFPASFNWIAAALSVPNEETGGGQGCTPGYWKQDHHFDDWTDPYDPTDAFSDYFEDAVQGKNLVQVLDGGGGGLSALGRHTVASLLNAANPDVSFDLTPQEVIDAFNSVYPGSKDDYEELKDHFQNFNEQGCPLNNSNENENKDKEESPSENDESNADNSVGSNESSRLSGNGQTSNKGGGAFSSWELLVALCLVFSGWVGRRRRFALRAR